MLMGDSSGIEMLHTVVLAGLIEFAVFIICILALVESAFEIAT